MRPSTLGVLLIVVGTIIGYVLASTVGERYPNAFVGASAVIIILGLTTVFVHVLRHQRQQRD
ncbi:hypothetical protein [Micromonospora trifolii]|uniref:hypothetical protein n=1 Tax=Micromonospora trifolii TaxID=2911208 RepID=UPI003CF68D14